jgi:hypothetical protein
MRRDPPEFTLPDRGIITGGAGCEQSQVATQRRRQNRTPSVSEVSQRQIELSRLRMQPGAHLIGRCAA